MADDIGKVHARSMESFNAALSQEMAAFQTARLSGDLDEAARAAQSMAGLRATMRELDSMAREAYQQQQAIPAGNKFGLTPTEVEVARNWTSDPNVSLEQREMSYAEQKRKYQHQRASGEYRDDQGMIRR